MAIESWILFQTACIISDFECKVDNDPIMVLDSSAGMKEKDFIKAKEFFADFAGAFNSHKQNRLGFKVFAIQPQTIFELTNIDTPIEMRTHILSAPYFGNGQLDAYLIPLRLGRFLQWAQASQQIYRWPRLRPHHRWTKQATREHFCGSCQDNQSWREKLCRRNQWPIQWKRAASIHRKWAEESFHRSWLWRIERYSGQPHPSGLLWQG